MYSFIEQRITYSLREVFSLLILGITFALPIILTIYDTTCSLRQKQPSRGILKKRCSENMQQIHKRIPMSKCDCKATLLKSHFRIGVLL